jgi:hypothetical protein
LVLQLGDGDDTTIINVNAIDVQVSRQGITTEEASSSGVQKPSRGKVTRKKSGPRIGPSQAAQQQPSPLIVVVKKALAKEIQKRRPREATAEARGRPLKAARAQKNRKWDQVYKRQAISLFLSKFSVGNDYAGCRNELLKLPGFRGVESGHIRGWVLSEARKAVQEPNALGLIVSARGKKPYLPKPMYDELVAHLQKLARVQAFTMNSTTLRPIALGFVVQKLGPPAVWSRSSRGGFTCGDYWMKQLAHAAQFRWRKPFGNSRKNPPNAKELIHDLILRMAYLMHEHDVPPCLTVNFDHSGLHFMQMRGNTWTVVEEDTDMVHQPRPPKKQGG